MDFNKQTPIIVRAFHYDLLDEPEEKNEVNVAIRQVVATADDGDGQDLDQETYRLLSRPLVEYIETLTYEVTQVALEEPINLDFQPNF